MQATMYGQIKPSRKQAPQTLTTSKETTTITKTAIYFHRFNYRV